MKKIIYSCSGCSSAAQMANWVALSLDRSGLAEMSCIAGIGGGVPALIKEAATADIIIAVDGCSLACAEQCLAREGFWSDLHFDLSKMGVKKRKSKDFDLKEARKVKNIITQDIRNNVGDSDAICQ